MADSVIYQRVGDYHIFLVGMPYSVHELISPTADGEYNIYINSILSNAKRIEAYHHALEHIKNGDFDANNIGADVQEIEYRAHNKK